MVEATGPNIERQLLAQNTPQGFVARKSHGDEIGHHCGGENYEIGLPAGIYADNA